MHAGLTGLLSHLLRIRQFYHLHQDDDAPREKGVFIPLRERRWFVLERPRRDTNGGSETEVTVTSEQQANAERNKETEKRQRRGEKAASFGGAVRGSVPEDELSGGEGGFY